MRGLGNCRKIKSFLVAGIFSGAVMVSAANISDIKIVQDGGDLVPVDQVIFNLQSRKGHEFSEQIIARDLKRLFSAGIVAKKIVNKAADGSVVVTLSVSYRTKVSKIVLNGNKKFSDDELRGEITQHVSNPQNDERIRESRKNLLEFYKSKGYQDATVVATLDNDADGKVVITFDIKEHLKQKVHSVSFEGNENYSSWRLRRNVETSHSYFSWLFDTGRFNRKVLEEDKALLREFYLEQGYLSFVVKESKVVETDDPEFVDVTFVVDEGPRYVVDNVTITGCKEFEAEALKNNLKLEKDDVYSSKLERRDLELLDRRYGAKGYAKFNCIVVKTPNRESGTVDLEYRINEGSIFTIRDITISGNKVTKDYVIRRELKLKPDDVLDQSQLKRDKSKILGHGNYSSVDIVTPNADKADRKDVNITVVEKDSRNIRIGAGFSDTDSAVGTIELSESNFDISDPSNYFRGGGQKLKLRASLGSTHSNVGLDFTEPWLFDEPLALTVSGYHTNSYYDDWDESRTGVYVGLARREVFDQFNTVRFGMRFEEVDVDDIDDDLSEEFQSQEGKTHVSTLSFGFNRDTRDSALEPTEGYETDLLAEFTSQGIGASNNYYRLEAKTSHYYPLLDEELIFHVGAKLGLIDTFNSTDEVPMFERYFLGGGDTVRGFDWRDIAPVDRNEDPIGGNTMALASTELIHPIYDYIRGAVFVDAGTVGKGSGNFEFDELSVGAGYGLRIKVPQLGAPMRFDIGYPIVKGRDHLERKVRFHFDFGFSW